MTAPQFALEGSARAGVVWHDRMNRWQARIKRSGTLHHLGTFTTEAEAIAAREAAELEMDGKVSGKRVRSAFDDLVAEMHPTPDDWPKPRSGVLAELAPQPETPAPHSTLSAEELFAFIHRSMTLRGHMVVWKGEAMKAVHTLWGKDCEILLSFRVNHERQVVRHADAAWMLTHQRPIPAGHTVKHSDGDVMNRDPQNMWLVETPY